MVSNASEKDDRNSTPVNGYRIVNTLHDEIIVEARDAIEDQVREIVKESMEDALELIVPEIPFIVEPKIADSWKG